MALVNHSKLLVILGPTSTGKTDLALRLASLARGELVSCDSRQVYKGLDIGTGKLPGRKVKVKKEKGYWEMEGIRVWMYDLADFNTQYTVFDYVNDACQVIDNITKRGKLPIIVGGTGLYLKALLEGLPSFVIPADQKLRAELEKLSLQELQEKLQKLSPQKWKGMNNSDQQNPRRLIRAIEILSIKTPSRSNFVTPRRWKGILKIGLTAPREILYRRIDERVVNRLDQGMVNEVKSLHKKGLSFKRMRQLGLEYGILADYLKGEIANHEELIKIMQGKIHGYARRQITWFKKEKDVLWFDITKRSWLDKVERQVKSWYYSFNDQTH